MRRNLVAEAQTQAAAQVAPQVAALSEALTQARIDRNSAIRAAAAANAGIARAIHLAGPSVKAAYTGAQALAAPAQGYSSGRYGNAASSEQHVGTTALASSLANSLKELSDRRISAAAGRAYATQRALSDYQLTGAKIGTQRQALAGQEGLYAASAFSKLTENAAARANARLLQERSLNSQSALQSQRLSSEATLTGEKLASSERVAGAKLQSSQHTAALGRRQSKLGRIDRAKLQTQRLQAQAKTQSGAPKLSATEQKGRVSIQTVKSHYDQVGDMSKAAAEARKQGYPEPIIGAAADLHSKGYVTPENIRKLEALGYTVPKEWTGVQVRPHTRKRRSP